METVTEGDVSKLSKIEQRKLKLAEYLVAKGRLKAPNPKPYLKDKPVTKKPAESNQKEKIRGDAKENCGINGTNVKEGKKLAEVNKNTSTKKGLSLHSQAKAPAQSSSSSNNTCQAGFRLLKTLSNSTASLQNPRKPHKAEETPASINAANRTRSQRLQNDQHKAHQAQPASNTTQKSKKSSLVSVCGPSKSGYGISAHTRTDQMSRTKTALQSTRPLARKLAETTIKTTSTANLKSQRPMSTTGTKIQTNIVSKPQAKLTQQPRSQSAVPKIGIHNSSSQSSKLMSRKSNSATNRFDVNQRKDISCIITKVDATKTKSDCSVTNRETRTSVSTLSNPANSKGSAIIKNKQNITVKPISATASTKLPGRNTKSCVLPQTSTAPQELQRPTKRSSQVKPAVQFQTPKSSFCPSTQGVRTAPVDGGKKPTAAQEQRLCKLQEWRESRGITYKRPPMPVRLMRRKTVSAIPQPYWASIEKEDEVHNIVFAVDRSLDDCIQLLQQGFPVEKVRDVLSRVPMAQKFAKYWICRARLMEREGNLDVLPMFQEAIRVVREPVDELRSVVFEILKKGQIQGMSPMPKEPEMLETRMHEEQEVGNVMCTPKPVGAIICGMRGDSSVVKYKITATPGGKRCQQGVESGQVDGHEIRFFTPVRRSVRIEKTAPRYPTALQEHDPCVTSLCDLAGESKEEVEGNTQPQSSPVYVYRENEALSDHVQVKLVYPEEVETL
ncbi:cytoskeleton-associated protein 2-like [Pimephales promelas]|uniref:cytoskeleton-associated protein 2-like n=1 Tax=Pimephales promelas TaxID=90988 RepID=UPI00195575E9|nr:cytoskeleton-associated protein 2-like [Pimephales promelas]KAG1957981.1 cytoskeleton-associated protein [Pimephales promelas]